MMFALAARSISISRSRSHIKAATQCCTIAPFASAECCTHTYGMLVNPETMFRKMLSMPREVWERIEDCRFENRIKTESEAIRRLIEAGLAACASGSTPQKMG
jgi:hypothetical protein